MATVDVFIILLPAKDFQYTAAMTTTRASIFAVRLTRKGRLEDMDNARGRSGGADGHV